MFFNFFFGGGDSLHCLRNRAVSLLTQVYKSVNTMTASENAAGLLA